MTTNFNPPKTLDLGGEPQRPERRTIDYWSFMVALFRSKFVILGAAAATAFVFLYLSFQITPLYTASTQILLKTRQDQVINIANVIDNPEFTDTAILSELAVLRSPPILLEVARRLDLASVAEFNPELDSPPLMTRIIDSAIKTIRGLFRPKSGDSDPASPDEVAADILAGKVSAEQFGLSYILVVRASSQSPDLAAAIANTVAAVYMESQITEKLQANERALEWLSATESDLRLRLQTAERQLETRRNDVLPERALSLLVLEQQRDRLAAAVIETDAMRAEAQANADRFDQMVTQGDFTAAMQFATSMQMSNLIDRREAALRQRRTLQQSGLTDTPGQQQVEQTIAEIEMAMDGELQQLSTGLQARIDSTRERGTVLRDQLVDLEQTIIQVTNQKLDLLGIEREVDAQRAVYDRFLNRLMETRERGDLQEPDARLVASARPPDAPSSPNRMVMLILGGILGGGLATAVVLFGEARREVFRSADETENRTGYPVLASMPVGLGGIRSWLMNPTYTAAAALNRLAALIDVNQPDGFARTILVTAALPSDRAAECALALARTMAEDGSRIALLDGWPNGAPALKEAMAALAADNEVGGGTGGHVEIIQLGTLSPRVTVDPLGQSAHTQIDTILECFDRVVLCAPPILTNARVLFAARRFDAVIMAFRWDKTPQGAVMAAINDARRLGLPLTGLVMVEVNFLITAAYDYRGAEMAHRQIARFERVT